MATFKDYWAALDFTAADKDGKSFEVKAGEIVSGDATRGMILRGGVLWHIKGLKAAIKEGWLTTTKPDLHRLLEASEQQRDTIKDLESSLANYREWKKRMRERLLTFFAAEGDSETRTDEDLLDELVRRAHLWNATNHAFVRKEKEAEQMRSKQVRSTQAPVGVWGDKWKEDMKVCYECQGKGEVVVAVTSILPGQTRMDPCLRCGGRGHL